MTNYMSPPNMKMIIFKVKRLRGSGHEIELFIVITILTRKLIQKVPARTPDCIPFQKKVNEW